MKLAEWTAGASLEGVEPARIVTVVAAMAIQPDSLQLISSAASVHFELKAPLERVERE